MLETTGNNVVYKIGHTRHSPLLLITYEAEKSVKPVYVEIHSALRLQIAE